MKQLNSAVCLSMPQSFLLSAPLMQASRSPVSNPGRFDYRGCGLILEVIGKLSALSDSPVFVADKESDVD